MNILEINQPPKAEESWCCMKTWKPSFNHFVDLFVSMARMTTPHGNEAFVWGCLPNAPHGAPPNVHPNFLRGSTSVDEHGNYIVQIPGNDGTLWVCHCDTADDHPTHVNLLKHIDSSGDLIISTDGETILGADDKIGCAIMACMIKAGVGGTYIFCAGEEVGCVGSGKIAAQCKKEGWSFSHVVSFDRKGTSSIITHQLGRRTASDVWATELADMLSMHGLFYKADDTGVYTDSNEFRDFCAECTNIGVGYDNQHTMSESANMSHAYSVLIAFIDIGHKGLPDPIRDPKAVEEDCEAYFDGLTDKDRDEIEWLKYRSSMKQDDKTDFYNGDAWGSLWTDNNSDKESQ